ncbi:HAMP domain-containing sensor histidine kinase [Synechococcus sp. CBW1006]|uniref:sensor histidine kinase n=1 Tax=Synechococcus sp. CBW1006 TaxID=1353138 RepID=UPI0018CF6692|nr:HAMP domain-containing sensor histidine kinase [Synechococcus sp. CBW1006]QPN67008.1 HAMP domain-containing histidine kinase [Synechococcus sp. CBW1006]
MEHGSTTLSALRQSLSAAVPAGHSDEDGVRRQWWAALATLQEDFLLPQLPLRGLWLAAPLPALYEPELLLHLKGWVWAPDSLERLRGSVAPLLPGAAGSRGTPAPGQLPGFERLQLSDDDGSDPLLLLITPRLQVALCLDGPPRERRLVARFDPAGLSAALSLLDRRLQQQRPSAAAELRRALRELGPLANAEDVALQFWPRMAERLGTIAPSLTLQPLVHGGNRAETPRAVSSELALLEALTHEVRTPLATIRTLIRSLLRRSDLSAVVRERLEQIDGECNEQIDRFGLIFHAAELQRQPESDESGHGERERLARTDLSALLRQLEPLWQRQLERRGLQFELQVADELPPVLSDPSRLETMLGGLVDRFSRGFSGGSRVRLSLQPAGNRLKLQICSEGTRPQRPEDHRRVGPVLSWDPETGSLQLSRQATQRLFHRLGGRLAERSGSDITVFFPVC